MISAWAITLLPSFLLATALGYLLLDMMGEAFLKSLFHEKNIEKYRKTD